jgi:hypothetical protein
MANKRVHTERRDTLLVMVQSAIPSGDAPAVVPLHLVGCGVI